MSRYNEDQEAREQREQRERVENAKRLRASVAINAARAIRDQAATLTSDALKESTPERAEAVLAVAQALARIAIKLDRGDLSGA